MKILDFEFIDASRFSRKVPVTVYLPEKTADGLPAFIFSPGYQSGHRKYTYLADYFVRRGLAFISIQHDIPGDKDGLEVIDPNAIQHDARKHLYERGILNILFTIKSLAKEKLPLNLGKFIIGGHSNGGDISKYFINNYPEYASHIILFDARRARLEPKLPIKLLMFEADDTSTDPGVLPDPGKATNSERSNLEWLVIKPQGAVHKSYSDDHITPELKAKVFGALGWFLN